MAHHTVLCFEDFRDFGHLLTPCDVQAEFALEVKRKVLPIYEEVFDVEYPLPKLDTLVVNDFDAGKPILLPFTLQILNRD